MNLLGGLLTEIYKPVINVKPFNCRPCLTFWLTMLGGGVLTWLNAITAVAEVHKYGAYELMGVTFLTGIINFLYIKSKFKIYE